MDTQQQAIPRNQNQHATAEAHCRFAVWDTTQPQPAQLETEIQAAFEPKEATGFINAMKVAPARVRYVIFGYCKGSYTAEPAAWFFLENSLHEVPWKALNMLCDFVGRTKSPPNTRHSFAVLEWSHKFATLSAANISLLSAVASMASSTGNERPTLQ